MAQRKLQELIDNILIKTAKPGTGMAQSDRHVTDTLITFTEIDDILKRWYEHQHLLTSKKIQSGINKKLSTASINQIWMKLKAPRRSAYSVYKNEVKRALRGRPGLITLLTPQNSDDLIWRFYSWEGRKRGISVQQVHQYVNKTAMVAMAKYIDKYWALAEKNLNLPSLIKQKAKGSGTVKGSLAAFSTNFSHGRLSGHDGATENVGSTTGSIGIIEDITSGALRNAFSAANPVVDQFIADITDMVTVDANVEVRDMSKVGGHKNTIMIKGFVSSNRRNSQTGGGGYDRDFSNKSGINKKVLETLQNTFDNLLREVETKGAMAGFNVEDISASPTQKEIVQDKAVRKVLSEIKKKNPKAKITFAKKKVKQKRRSTAKGTRKAKGTRGKKKTSAGKAISTVTVTGKAGKTSKAGKAGRAVATAKAAMNPIGLQQLIQKVLPDEIRKNMGPYPRRLENRTGRFADSAEITNIVPMPRSVEIRYSYQKNPYEVFEPGSGNPMASPGRDPRVLIGGTIREIAQGMMGTKFGLIRTKRV